MNTILSVKNLVVEYNTDDGCVQAVNDLSVDLKEGESLGLVGETGAGKTTLAKAIMRLIPDPPGKICSGSIEYMGEDLLKLSDAQMRRIRGKNVSMIFQDPMTSMNPVMTVGEQIAEVICQHEHCHRKEALEKAGDMLELVGISKNRMDEYPHQFSGGMKQRAVIAMALACDPKILIADEPTTALDVTIQAQVLDMIRRLSSQRNTSVLLITHDLGVVAQNCKRVAIVYAGNIVEYGTCTDVFANSLHPYTVGLFDSIPKLNEDVERLTPIKGQMPDPTNLPKGCKFCDRCQFAEGRCEEELPGMYSIGSGHYVRCFRYEGKEEVQDGAGRNE